MEKEANSNRSTIVTNSRRASKKERKENGEGNRKPISPNLSVS